MTACLQTRFVEHSIQLSIQRVVMLVVSTTLIWCVVLVVQSTGEENQPDQGQIPPEILDQVKAVLKSVSPHGEVLEEQPDQFQYGDRLISVSSHAVRPNGHIPKKSHIQWGPRVDGFVLG